MDNRFITHERVVMQPPSSHTEEMMDLTKLKCWACFDISCLFRNPTTFERFCNELYTNFCEDGMARESKPYISIFDHGPLGRAFLELEREVSIERKEKLQLLIYVVPTIPVAQQNTAFEWIDRNCKEMGIIHQRCMAEPILDTFDYQVLTVANSIKDKLRFHREKVFHGLPKELPPNLSGSTIVFGRDVTYHELEKDHIDGIVASMDNWPQLIKFKGLVSLRDDSEGITQDGERMIGEHLISFEKSVGTLPEIVIFYRDGVGEGPFNEEVQYWKLLKSNFLL